MKSMFLLVSLSLLSGRMDGYEMSKKPKSDFEKVAEQFIEWVDVNNSEQLATILDEKMVQYVSMGDQFFSSTAEEFVQMVAEKKIGGKIREIKVHQADVLRGSTAQVKVQAVSNELDFMYQLSLVHKNNEWIIVSALVDIVPV